MSEIEALYFNGPPAEVDAQEVRQAFQNPVGEGVDDPAALEVTDGSSGIAVDVASGIGWVRGDSVPRQGLYRVFNDATVNSDDFEGGAMDPANGANPRLDQIVARVYDDDHDSSGSRKWRLEVVTGTATSGATLDNRNGAASLPDSAMLLADVLVPASASSLSASDVRDRRSMASIAIPPPLADSNDLVIPMLPMPAIPLSQGITLHNIHDTHQTAMLCYLPSLAEDVSELRWVYEQGDTDPQVGNYVIGIYDASGRLIVDTGSVAFTGAVSTIQERDESITSTTFEPGLYWVLFGVNTTGTNDTCYFMSSPSTGSGDQSGALFPKGYVRFATSGGITPPDTILSFTDPASDNTDAVVPVPVISLVLA